MLPYNKNNKHFSQLLRKDMTPEEKHLWYDFLSKLPIAAKRQKVLGDYIVDFYIPSAKVVIEIDGAQHYEPGHRIADSERDLYLKKMGIRVLRYTNFDIKYRFEGVAGDVLRHIGLNFSDLKFER